MSKPTVVYEIIFLFIPNLPEHDQIRAGITNPTFIGIHHDHLFS
jgi:hypothetical protein